MSFHQVPMDDGTKALLALCVFVLALYFAGLFIFII